MPDRRLRPRSRPTAAIVFGWIVMAIAGALTFAFATHHESAVFDAESRINFKEMK